MANMFGVDIETPEELQQRILGETLAKMKAAGPTTGAGQVGQGIGNLLNNLFVNKPRAEKAEAQQKALDLAANVKNVHIQNGTDPFEAEMIARAAAAAQLRGLGGAQNIALANQIRDGLTQLQVEKQQRDERSAGLKAQREASESTTDLNRRKLLKDSTMEELDIKIAEAQANGNESTARGLEGIKEERRYQEFVPVAGINPDSLGITQEQLDGLATPYGVPKDTLSQLVNQRRVALEDERLEFSRTKLPAGMQAKQEEAIGNVYRHSGQAREHYQLAQDVMTIPRGEGAPGRVQKWFSDQLGIDDPMVYLQSRINRAVTTAALSRRPPGSMTEAEWQFLFKGEIPVDADANLIAQYMTRSAQLEQLQAEYEREKANWLDSNRDLRGFTNHWDSVMDDKFEQIEASMPVPSYRAPTGGSGSGGGPKVISVTPVQPQQQQQANPVNPQLPGTM